MPAFGVTSWGISLFTRTGLLDSVWELYTINAVCSALSQNPTLKIKLSKRRRILPCVAASAVLVDERFVKASAEIELLHLAVQAPDLALPQFGT